MRLLLLLALLLPAAHAQSALEACENGTAGSYSCQAVDLLSRLTHAQMGGNYGNDIWGWTDPDSGREFALVGQSDGVAFVEITTPTAPVYLGRLPTHSTATVWRDVKVYAGHAFVVSEAGGHGMQVFDLSRLLAVQAPPVTFTEDAHYDQISSAHNIAINEETGYAYLVGSGYSQSTGLPAGCNAADRRGHHVVNIQDPLNPVFETCFSDAAIEQGPRSPGYTHDTQCIVYDGPDADYTGREICVGSNEDVLTFFDVTDKASVEILSQGLYPNYAYTHQGWFTDDRRFFLADDEIDENTFGFNTRTLIFDVTDLDNPSFIGTYDHDVASTDHNQYVRGRYSYQSNYSSGLRILDLQPLLDGTGMPVLAGYFDTFPAHDSPGYDGQWSNYPYFPSGVVIANDGDNGLFVLQVNLDGVVSTVRPPEALASSLEVYPNPTSGAVSFDVSVAEVQHARVAVYDLLGRRVHTAFEGTLQAGAAVPVQADLSALAAGLYVVRLEGESVSETRRLVLAH